MALAARGAGTPIVSATDVRSGRSSPWDLAFTADGRMLVTERPGNLLVFASGAVDAAELANSPIANVRADGAAGLMGIALDPAFTSNGFVYVCASRTDGGRVSQVLRYRMTGTTVAFDDYVIRTGTPAGGNHDGCRIRFGPDGKLWVTMGEVGNPQFSQNPTALNAKILRVNPDGSMPVDNRSCPARQGAPSATGWATATRRASRSSRGPASRSRSSTQTTSITRPGSPPTRRSCGSKPAATAPGRTAAGSATRPRSGNRTTIRSSRRPVGRSAPIRSDAPGPATYSWARSQARCLCR